MLRTFLLLLYAGSGFVALLFEVTWTRLLSLHLGQTVTATSTVLAAFMGGLAAGAAVGGQLAPRLDPFRALRTYGLLEAGVGVFAIVFPLALAAARPLLAAAYGDGGGPAFALLRVAIGLALVALPATAMGATFPLAIRACDAGAAGAGALYAANAVGGTIGVLASGFWLLPAFGTRATTWAGTLVSLTVAAGAWWLSARTAAASGVGSGSAAESGAGSAFRRTAAAATPPPAYPPWLGPAVVFVTGFVALATEVVVTRLAALLIGPTTYAFSAMLLAFIGGLAVGAAAGARLARREAHAAWLGAALFVAAAGIANLFWLVGRVPLTIAASIPGPRPSFAALLAEQVLAILLALAPATIAFGAAFPLALALARRGTAPVARTASVIYAVNTAGAIAGSLATGFLLVPRLGLEQTLAGAAGVLALTGVTIAWLTSRARGRAVAVLAALTIAALVAVRPQWDRAVLSSGVYKYRTAQSRDLESSLAAGRLLYYADGASATVSVRDAVDARSLAIDGKVDASNAGDMLTQKLLAHLPLALHPAPADVAILGLGSGVTAGAALIHPIARLDVLEISPEVVEASRFFAAENRNALSDPRTRLIVGDGRTHLQLTTRRYDVIVSEPSNPWMAGVAALFTRDFFESVRGRLNPQGIFCQWAHTYDLSDANLRSIARTVGDVFPHVTMWLVGEGDVLFVASSDAIEPRLAQVREALTRPGVPDDLQVVAADAFGVLSLYLAGGPDLAAYAGEADIQTDDRRALEFEAPRDMHEGRGANVAGALRKSAASWPRPPVVAAALAGATAVDWRNRGRMLLNAGAHDEALADLRRAVEAQPSDDRAVDLLLDAAAGARMTPDAIVSMLTALVERDGRSIPVRLALSRVRAATGNAAQAMADAQAAAAIDSADPRPLEQAASILADVQEVERLRIVVRELEGRRPTAARTLYYAATLAFLEERFAQAESLAARSVAADPAEAKAHNLLGAARASQGLAAEAEQAFLQARRTDPREPSTYMNLGQLALQRGDTAGAVSRFAEALELDPVSEGARTALADALQRAGEHERAVRVRASGRAQ